MTGKKFLQLDVLSIVVTVIIFLIGAGLEWGISRHSDNQARQLSNSSTAQGRQLEWRLALKVNSMFPGADLHNLDLTGLYIPDSNLGDSNDDSTNFSNGTFTGVHFEGSDLRRSNFTDARLDGASFQGADLVDANFTGASLVDTSFLGADLTGATFSHTGFWNTDFSGANLTKARLPLKFTDGACWDKYTRWPPGYHPGPPLCSDEPTPTASNSTPLVTVQYHLDATVAPVGKPWRIQVVLDSVGQQFEELVRFDNEGAVILNGVTLLTDLGQNDQYLKPISVSLINGNYPKGYSYEPNSIQAGGQQVNVDIGSYDANASGVAYLKIKYVVTALPISTTCMITPLTVKTYASPQGYGAIDQTVSVNIESDGCSR